MSVFMKPQAVVGQENWLDEVYECKACGALILDCRLHGQWHKAQTQAIFDAGHESLLAGWDNAL